MPDKIWFVPWYKWIHSVSHMVIFAVSNAGHDPGKLSPDCRNARITKNKFQMKIRSNIDIWWENERRLNVYLFFFIFRRTFSLLSCEFSRFGNHFKLYLLEMFSECGHRIKWSKNTKTKFPKRSFRSTDKGLNTSQMKAVYLLSVSLFARLRKKRKKLFTFFDTAIRRLNCDWPTVKSSIFCQDLRDRNSFEIQNTMTGMKLI